MLSMDEFVMTFFVIGRESTLPLYIFSEMRREVTPAINAVSTLLLGFTLLVWVVGFGLAVRSRRASQRIEAWGGGSD
jgi:ABC-type spermidine/putrescine transport system permease subunit II